jgi:prolipoprotein diacylglyceryl transferase
MHPVLFEIPGTVLKLLALCAALSGPIAWGAARARGGRLSSDDRYVYGWFALVACAVFALACPAVLREGPLRAALSAGSYVGPWTAVPVFSYGVLLASGILAGAFAARGLARRLAIDDGRYARFCAVAAASALAGARGLYLLVQWRAEFVARDGSVLWSRVLFPRANGFVVYGGLLAGVLGVWLFARRTRTRAWQWTDLGCVGVPLGLALGRLGCFLAGCDFGRPLGAGAPAWLAEIGRFPRWMDAKGSPAWFQHTHRGLDLAAEACARVGTVTGPGRCALDPHATHSAPVHPTQLYELCLGLALFALLRPLWPRRRFDGQISLAFMVLYGLGRTALELVRDDVERGSRAGLSTSQWIGLVSALVGALWYARRSRLAGPAAEALEVS